MKLRNVIVMFVLAALAVAALVYFQGGGGGGGTSLPATLPTFTKSAVTKVTATVEGNSLVMRRRADRSDAWEVESGTSTVRAEASAVDDLLSELARQEVRASFERTKLSDADVADWGLGDPKTSIEIVADGQTTVVRYGKRTREGTAVRVDTGPGTNVWIVGGSVVEQMTAVLGTGARSKRLTDLRLYDVGKVEIVRGGVTTLEASKDPSQIWRFTQPFKGFADPQEFERFLNRLVNAEVSWVELGATDLVKYGLDAPRAEVRLHPKKDDAAATAILVGADVPEEIAKDPRMVHVLEAGRPNVATTSFRFLESVLKDAGELRDRSFSRLGIDGVALKVKLGTVAYELRKEGASWDITAPDRFPADDRAVNDVVEEIRSWRTDTFLDAARPEEHGIAEGGDSIEIELQGGAKVTFRLGSPSAATPDDTRRYAVRRSAEGESGVELVDGTLVARLAKGYGQFRRKAVRPLSTFMGDLTRIAREAGTSDEGQKVKIVVLTKNDEGRWKFDSTLGDGQVGAMDEPAVSRLVSVIPNLAAKDWLFWDEQKAAEFGISTPEACATGSIRLEFSGKSGDPPDGKTQTLLLGNKRPEGGWYCRFMDDKGWVFVLGEEEIQALIAPLAK